MSLARLIAAQRTRYGIPHATACRALGVSQAWFYKWVRGDTSLRRSRRRALAALIAYLFRKHHGSYGAAPPASRVASRSLRDGPSPPPWTLEPLRPPMGRGMGAGRGLPS